MSQRSKGNALPRIGVAAGLAVGMAFGGYGLAAAANGTAPAKQVVKKSAKAVKATKAARLAVAANGGTPHELLSDASVVAKAIGITEAALNTELATGKTIAQVATAHNVTPQAVVDALVADSQSELAAAVTAGTITQAQADALKANLTARATAQVNGQFGGRGFGGPGRGGHGFGGPGFGGHNEAVSDASVVAKAIGITEAALNSELATGKTIAQVATAHNVTAQAVIDALVADSQSELAAAVTAGTITQAQADALKANLTARATAQVNGQFGGRGFGGPGRGGHGFGGRGFGGPGFGGPGFGGHGRGDQGNGGGAPTITSSSTA